MGSQREGIGVNGMVDWKINDSQRMVNEKST